jgi:hypothetical protein
VEFVKKRHTGLWPFSIFNVGLQGRQSDPGEVQAQIFDSVALAFSASSKFTDVGWIGLEVMPSSFLYSVMDADREGKDVAALISTWVEDNRATVADEYESRLQSYSFDDLAKRALHESLISYRSGSYLSVVRTLMPEFERFGRMVTLKDGAKPRFQKQAVAAIKEYISELPASFYPHIESVAAYRLIEEDLFARCLTEVDALALSNPNRHAEMHGLNSYGDLRGATRVLSAADFLVSVVNTARSKSTKY